MGKNKGERLDLKEIGIDLTQKDSKGNYLFIEDLLVDEKGRFDPEVIDTQYGVPIVKPNTVARKFLLNNQDKILSLIWTKAEEAGFKKAKAKSAPPPTLTDIPASGTVNKEKAAGVIRPEDVDGIWDGKKIDEMISKFET